MSTRAGGRLPAGAACGVIPPMRALLVSALLGALSAACTDARLEPLAGEWAIDRAALEADPRLATLPAAQRRAAADRVIAAHGLRMVFSDGALTLIRGERRWTGTPSVLAADGDVLKLAADSGQLTLRHHPAEGRLEVHTDAHRLTLRRVDMQPSDPLKGDPDAPASVETDAPAKGAE